MPHEKINEERAAQIQALEIHSVGPLRRFLKEHHLYTAYLSVEFLDNMASAIFQKKHKPSENSEQSKWDDT